MKISNFFILAGVLVVLLLVFGGLTWTNANVVSVDEAGGGGFSGFLMGAVVVAVVAILGWFTVRDKV